MKDPTLLYDRKGAGPGRGLSLAFRSLLGVLEVESKRRFLGFSGELPCPVEFVRLCARRIPALGLGLGRPLSESAMEMLGEPISSS